MEPKDGLLLGLGKGEIGIKLPDLRAQPNAKRGESKTGLLLC